MEPDSHRSKNAFEEMLQLMQVKEITEKPVERSFIQQQLQRQTQPKDSSSVAKKTPPLTNIHGINRELLYNEIEKTKDSLKNVTIDSLEIDT